MDHNTVLFFSPDGTCRFLKAYQLPLSAKIAMGPPLTQVWTSFILSLCMHETYTDSVTSRSVTNSDGMVRWCRDPWGGMVTCRWNSDLALGHLPLLGLTASLGIRRKGYQLGDVAQRFPVHGTPQSDREMRLQVLNVSKGTGLAAILNIDAFEEGDYLVMLSKNGLIKRTPLKAFTSVRASGIAAMKLKASPQCLS